MVMMGGGGEGVRRGSGGPNFKLLKGTTLGLLSAQCSLLQGISRGGNSIQQSSVGPL